MGDWLHSDLVIFGIHFHNWMALAVGVIGVWFFSAWLGRHRRH